MKTAIMTFVRAYNHGAVLQTYALQQKLKELGVDNEVIDYFPKYFKDMYSLAYLGKLRIVPCRPLKLWKKYLPVRLILDRRLKGFEKFISKNIKLTSAQYSSAEDLCNANFTYDKVICGSDQVWNYNTNGKDPSFFLDFVNLKTQKLSYAASFGDWEISDELEEKYKEWLSGWVNYSVREQIGVDIVRSLVGEEAVQCCDPTILLDKKQWDKIRSKRKEKKPYILVYYMKDPDWVLETASKLANIKKLKIISITSAIFENGIIGTQAQKVGAKHKGDCAPDEFVSLFAHAEYVITDSFHGSVFSILYHRRFLSLSAKKSGKQNTRIKDLLASVGLSSRIFCENVNQIDKEIDWDDVERKLKEYRQKSVEYIKSLPL